MGACPACADIAQMIRELGESEDGLVHDSDKGTLVVGPDAEAATEAMDASEGESDG